MMRILEPLVDKFKAFKFNTIEIQDEHNESEILKSISMAKLSVRPTVIICNTTKEKEYHLWRMIMFGIIGPHRIRIIKKLIK